MVAWKDQAVRIDGAQEADPVLAVIADLLPTQVTVGMREVDIKRRRWRERNSEQAARFLNTHSVPVILGPDNHRYIVDRHHLTRALHEEGVSEVPVSIVANMSALRHNAFWTALENHGWTHPFDDEGRRFDCGDIPKSVSDLIDDPYRSLAGALKRAGGYTKDRAPFSEFRWADFMRSRIGHKTVERDFDYALVLAMKLAPSREAMTLPGWRGPQPNN